MKDFYHRRENGNRSSDDGCSGKVRNRGLFCIKSLPAAVGQSWSVGGLEKFVEKGSKKQFFIS